MGVGQFVVGTTKNYQNYPEDIKKIIILEFPLKYIDIKLRQKMIISFERGLATERDMVSKLCIGNCIDLLEE